MFLLYQSMSGKKQRITFITHLHGWGRPARLNATNQLLDSVIYFIPLRISPGLKYFCNSENTTTAGIVDIIIVALS